MIEKDELFRKIVNKEQEFRTKEFLAPYTNDSKTAIIKMDGLNYKFHISGFVGSGIGRFTPVSPTFAKYKEEADWETVRSYFDKIPQLNVILCYETKYGWVAYPDNISVARNKFYLDGEILVRNVSDAERFDVIVARFDGLHFWADGICSTANSIKSQDTRACFNSKYTSSKMREKCADISGITPENIAAFDLAVKSWESFKSMSTEDILNKYLIPGGGTLGSYVVRGPNIEIKWTSKKGNDYTSLVNKESMDVVSAGICLDGEDEKFHLKDLPFLVSSGEEQGLIYRMPIRNIDFDAGIDEEES